MVKICVTVAVAKQEVRSFFFPDVNSPLQMNFFKNALRMSGIFDFQLLQHHRIMKDFNQWDIYSI